MEGLIPNKSDWRKWSKLEWIDVLFAVITILPIIGSGFFYIQDRFFHDPEIVTIPLFEERVHLGDNSFSRQGGTTIPKIDDSFSAKFKNTHVVYYEKNTGQFLTNLGSSNYLQALAKKYGTLFKETNLGAWQNIFARIPDPNDPIKYEGDRVNIGSTELIWKEKVEIFVLNTGLSPLPQP